MKNKTKIISTPLLHILFLFAGMMNIIPLAGQLIDESPLSIEFNKILANSHLEGGYAFGKFIGIEKDYAQAGLFAPFALSPQWLAFTDLQGYRFQDHTWASSFGVGLRAWNDNQRIVGANFYYDRTWKNKAFHRLGLGFEWITPSWDFRLNGYVPLGSQKHRIGQRRFRYEGDYNATVQLVEYPFSGGLDAQVGTLLAFWHDFNIYGAIGPYYYPKNHFRSVFGGFTRLEFNWKSFVSMQMRVSFDRVYHTHVQGLVKINIPFEILSNWPSLDDLYNVFFTQPVRREGIIFSKRCCQYKWNW